MTTIKAATLAALLGAVFLAGPTPEAFAQTGAAKKATGPKAPAAAGKAIDKEGSEAAASGAGGGRSRLDVLEQQMVDMQVAIGTLESFGRGGGSGAAGSARSAGGGIDQGRVDALETQVRALASQVDQLSQQIRQMSQQRPQAAANASPPAVAGGAAIPDNDPIGRIIGGGQARVNSAVIERPAPGTAAPPVVAGPVIASDATSKQAYEVAYGYLLAQDYPSAESAFDEFLHRFPSDALAGNAQYWLGETHFVRGQFKPAAAAFLKGYQTYGRSAKAPDSLLKLAMSLEKLGQKDAACASFGELSTKFPTAPGHVRSRADSERRRLGCA